MLMVSQLFELSRGLWLEVQLSSPPWLRRTLVQTLGEAKDVARQLGKPYLSLYQWEGQGKGGPLTVNHAGLGHAKPFLKSILFVEEPTERQIGQVRVWYPSELAHLSNGDITIIHANKHLIRYLPGRNALILPAYVDMILDVQGDWQDVQGRFRKSVRKELRLTKKYDYQYEVSHGSQGFDMFYHDMYLPTMESRHGALASLIPTREAYQYFRHGLLFLVKRNGRYVCGSIFYIERDTVHFMLMGVLNGDQRWIEEGAVGALNYLRIQWAHQKGYKAVNFGGCRPFVTGLFSYKRKWGTAVTIPPQENNRIWIKIQRNTSAVSQFLKSNPCLTLGNGGGLQVLVVTDDPDNVTSDTEAAWHKLYATPGLSSLLVRSVANLMGKSNFQ